MKRIMMLFGFISLSAFSDLFAESNINLGSFEHTKVMNATQDIFREVVSYEPYETTCSREVSDGTSRECRTVMENHCTKIPGVGDDCRQEPIELCEDVQSTRTETYPCTEHRKVVDYVYDYTVQAKVEVTKTLRSKNYDLLQCTLHAKLTETDEKFFAHCGTAIVKLNIVEKTGTAIDRAIKLDLDFYSIDELAALKFGIAELAFKKGELSFISADLQTAKNFALNITLIRNRFLLKDKVLHSKELKTSQLLSVSLGNGRFKNTLNLAKLVPAMDSAKKHTVTLNMKSLAAVDLKGAINLPALSNTLKESLIINE